MWESYSVLNLCSTRLYYHSLLNVSREFRTNFLVIFRKEEVHMNPGSVGRDEMTRRSQGWYNGHRKLYIRQSKTTVDLFNRK